MTGPELLRKIDSQKVLICGPSGVGKTTLMEDVAVRTKLSFLRGSIRDLIPAEKETKHYDMMQYDATHIHARNTQILTARKKAYKIHDNFISDRSFLDVAAYEILTNSKELPCCDITDIIELVNECNRTADITHIIYIPFDKTMFYEWEIEEDGKRVTNPYFQMQVSRCFDIALEILGTDFGFWDNIFRTNKRGRLYVHDKKWHVPEGSENNIEYSIPLLVLKERDRMKRIGVVKKFINEEA